MTLYLKYRPQKVSELNLVQVRQTLEKILAAKDLPHALLFVGPRGTGKTSSARILAKTINGDDQVLNSTDVVEIDAASNRGIDEIRALRESITLAPMSAKYKVYIIDEVHMLTTEAFNALLKTLEEPPAHAVFVLCTTEYEKLPKTITSRCVEVRFHLPSQQELVTRLTHVAKTEKIKLSTPDLELIARASKGSFRDAIKLLEQVSVTGSVDQVLQMSSLADPEQFIKVLESGDTTAGLNYIAGVVSEGISPKAFIEKCVEYLREKLLETHDRKYLLLISDFETVYDRTRTSAIPQLPLEILVVEKSSSSKPSIPTVSKPPPPEPRPPSPKPNANRGKFSLIDVQAKWPDILKAVKPHNHSVEALLRSTKPTSFDGDLLQLEVFYKFHKDKLETEKCRSIVETSVGEFFGIGTIRLELKLGERVEKREEVSGTTEEDIVRAAEEIFKVEAM